MTHEERKALEARRKVLVEMKEEAVGRANQAAGGIAVIDSLLAAAGDKVELATIHGIPAQTGTDG
jgi:hypothetical protein